MQKKPIGDKNLNDLVEQMVSLRGTSEQRLSKEIAVSKFIAAAGDRLRILCRGEWRNSVFHYPAVLVFNEEQRTTEVWIAEGDDNTMSVKTVDQFYSTIPHAGIAREVFGDDATKNSTI
jgi:hypothetical protein